MKWLRLLLAAIGLSHAQWSFAALPIMGQSRTTCARLFAFGKQPVLLNAKLGQRTTPLCYQGYGVAFSGVTKTPLWSAEVLTAAAVHSARMLDRFTEFHPDSRLPLADRSELSDYRRSGFDRGHMSPSGDMASAAAQQESFSLANIVPQAPGLNRGSWSNIETAVRNRAERAGLVYIVTGPLFEGQVLRSIGRGVIVPSSVFKAVYVPGRGAVAYVATNVDPAMVAVISINELTARARIDVFPGIDARYRAVAMMVPMPHPHRYRRRNDGGSQWTN